MSLIRYLGVATHPGYLRGDSCSWKGLVKATMELQGCRVMAVTGDAGGLVAELVPDLRLSPRCGQCGAPGRYRDTRGTRRFRHVPLWGDRGGAPLCATARTVCSVRWRPCRIAAVGQRQTADDPRAHGGARDVGPDPALAAGRAAVSVLVGHRGDGGRGGGRLWPGAAGPG